MSNLLYMLFLKALYPEVTSLIFALIGEKGLKESRKKMYEHSVLAIFYFIIVYTINMLDFLLPRSTKGGFVAVKAIKIKSL